MFLRNNTGLTLVEVLITLAIVALVFSLIAPLFITGIQFFGESNSMVMDQTNLRRIMTDMSREIRDASTVNVVSSTKIEVGDCTYEYVSNDKQITKYFADTGETAIVSSRVEKFEINQTDSIIEFTVKAEGGGSTIVTKVSVRERVMPTPEIA